MMNPVKTKEIITVLIIFLVMIAIGFVKNSNKLTKYRESQMLMGTIVQLDTCIDKRQFKNVEDIYKLVWQRLEDISWRMNVYDEQSDVTRVNQSNAAPVVVGQDTFQVINNAIKYSSITKGTFDVTVWPIIKLWKEAQKLNKIPTDAAVKETLSIVGPEYIQLLSDNRVLIKNGATQIDLGGIAKGYAIDEAARIFRENGFENFYIDAGGDVFVGGLNCDQNQWQIGIRDPRNKNEIYAIIHATNVSIATSGNYEQFIRIEGQDYSHIIDPRTGWPQREVLSASVVAPTAQEADAYATALTILGDKEGNKLVDTLKSPYASLIIQKAGNNNIKEFASKELKRYLR